MMLSALVALKTVVCRCQIVLFFFVKQMFCLTCFACYVKNPNVSELVANKGLSVFLDNVSVFQFFQFQLYPHKRVQWCFKIPLKDFSRPHK